MVFKLSGLVVTVGNDMVSRHVAGWGQFYVYGPFAQFCQLDSVSQGVRACRLRSVEE